MNHRSTVDLTIAIDTGTGLPDDITAQTVAAIASRAIADYLSGRQRVAAVKAQVRSAFIVRTSDR